MQIDDYFQSPSDYAAFIENIKGQLDEITFKGERKIESPNSFKKSAAIIRILPFEGMSKESYYLSLVKKVKVTLD